MTTNIHTSSCRLLVLVAIATAIFALAASASADTVLYKFTGGPDGSAPYGKLLPDQYGNLYGTTSAGGTGYGTVFVLCAPAAPAPDIFPCLPLAASWTFNVLYSFTGFPDGANPYSTLIFNSLYAGRDFTIYGTTYNGGQGTCPGSTGTLIGCGTVFELCAPSNFGGCGGVNLWKEKVLHSFAGGADGSNPFGGVITDKASDLYGTTVYGGKNGKCLVGTLNEFCGTVFWLKPNSTFTTWTEHILHRFKGGIKDGANPYAPLCCNTIFADSYFYGTTYNGRKGAGTQAGITFSIKNIATYPETVLYNFCSLTGCVDGSNPYGDVVFDTASPPNMYGTTFNGGTSSLGTYWKAASPWTAVTTLWDFTGSPGDGANPASGLMLDSSDNLYGTTYDGGTSGVGTVAEWFAPFGPDGILWDFTGSPDGANPFGGVIYDTPVSGTSELYGTTTAGGFGHGVIYSQP
jgi:hypothetical protein